MRRTFVFAAAFVVALSGHAQLGGVAPPDPLAVLAQAKAASGGSAWDALRTQHSKVNILAGSVSGQAERWSEFATGRSLVTYTMGPVTGAAGFDGTLAWSQDASGRSQAEANEIARELAVNAAYRDRLAFWYPERAPARISYKERAEADGAFFDVIRVTPEGGRPFELWVNTETKLIERLVEREAHATRTEIYMDLRDVDGVQIPFRVRAARGEGRHDEVVTVESMQFNQPLDNVRFAQPPPPKPDFAFAGGRASVEVPFEFINGHVFVKVMIDGKGPIRMLLDSRGHNVLLPKLASAPSPPGQSGSSIGVARAQRLDIGGLTFENQAFATIDLTEFMRRAEGLDDIGGVLGGEIFRRVVVRLDYERSRATFYDPAKFKYTGNGTKVSLAFRGELPQVRARVDGVAGNFHIDTGSRSSLTLTRNFVDSNDLLRKYERAYDAVVGSGVSGPIRAKIARAKSLELGDIVIADPLVALAVDDPLADSEIAGSVGNGVLRKLTVIFDFPGSAIYFEKNASFAQRDVVDRAGLWVERVGKGFEVVDVVAGGPGATAGVKPGDVIVAIDGKPASALTLASVRALLRAETGRKVRLTVDGGASRMLVLRDLL